MNDFDDNFGGPAQGTFQDPGLFGVDSEPFVLWGLLALAVVVTIICLAGYFLGRMTARRRLNAQRKASRDAIYGSIRYALDKALKSSGAVVVERGREVADLLEARLGLLIGLHAKLGKSVATLRSALNPKKPEPPKPAEVKTPRATYNHAFEVWDALQELSLVWQKDTIDELLRSAQAELSTPPVMPRTEGSYARKPETKAPVASVAASDADQAAAAPAPVAPQPAQSDDAAETAEPSPPPAPAAPAPKRRGGKLPAHKRNMLA